MINKQKNYALVGNPNSGKTAIFNRLTGTRQKVANYAGVTIERKQGFLNTANDQMISILDLPGTYSLETTSPDEAVTRDYCLNQLNGESLPDAFVYIADASNLKLHLRFLLELIELGHPILLVLNKLDSATKQGITINVTGLSEVLGIPVTTSVAVNQQGVASLIKILSEEKITHPQQKLSLSSTEEKSAFIKTVLDLHVKQPMTQSVRLDDKVDRVLLHPLWGSLFLFALLFTIFQAVYSWAAWPQELIENSFGAFGEWVSQGLPEGPLNSLLVDGIIAGCAGVLVFLPQILILFFFILVLEESGYLPRAAFLLDPIMRKVGLSGRSFIPLLSSFACAVPGIMATRAIQNPRDRLITLSIAPLMTCSARLPVYALLIAAFVPNHSILGFFNLQGIVLFVLYFAGIISAWLVAWIAKKLNHQIEENPLLLEIPEYRLPRLYNLGLGLWERGSIFLKRVGTIILALSIMLWALLYFPLPDGGTENYDIAKSFAGQIGYVLTYIFAPIGFNLAICIALVPGMAARELAVSSLATVYALSNVSDENLGPLSQLLQTEWSLATAMSVLVWYIYAPMCIATLATIRRETISWKYTLIITGYLFGLAYIASLITYQFFNSIA